MSIQYFAYVRKSTEGEERQALSIESQKDKVRDMFPSLEIVDILEEKHSAFKPYNRPVFEKMIERIKKGEAQGIIAWHPDRLSRNEIDASTLTYLVRTNVIKDLKFGSYNFDNSPEGIMMLQLALSQSQYFSSKLGKDVKRGLDKKLDLGWFPGVAPEGYLNDMRLEKGQRTIIIDKKRFPLIRKGFDLFLTGTYSADQVRDIMNNEWGYTMRKRGKTGGAGLTRTTWYRILARPFYAGIIEYRGQEFQGKHKPMITVDEFNRVQELLGAKGGKRRPQKKDFTYTGLFTCGFCGCAITAEHKTKYIKSAKEMKSYDYYHCTHKKREINCKQGSVEEQQIYEAVHEIVSKIEIHPKFLEWGLAYIDEQANKEQKIEKKVQESVEEKESKIKEQISGLTLMRAKGLLDDEEYIAEKEKLKKEIDSLKKESAPAHTQEDIIETWREAVNFSATARTHFEEGGKREKRLIVKKLGSNQAIIDKKVHIILKKWYLPIYECAEVLNAEFARLEPMKFSSVEKKNEALNKLRLTWLPGSDSNRRPIG